MTSKNVIINGIKRSLYFSLRTSSAMEESDQKKGQKIMSNYGVKTYTPEQTKEQWRESMRVQLGSYLVIPKSFLPSRKPLT